MTTYTVLTRICIPNELLSIAAQQNTESLLHYRSAEYQLQPLRASPARLEGSSITTQRSPFAQYRETALLDHPEPNVRVKNVTIVVPFVLPTYPDMSVLDLLLSIDNIRYNLI